MGGGLCQRGRARCGSVLHRDQVSPHTLPVPSALRGCCCAALRCDGGLTPLLLLSTGLNPFCILIIDLGRRDFDRFRDPISCVRA